MACPYISQGGAVLPRLVNFYRKFINNYSRLATPLTTLTKNLVKFTWSDEAEAAFRSLQQAFTSAPILKHY